MAQKAIIGFIISIKQKPSNFKYNFLSSIKNKLIKIIDNVKGYKVVLSILKEWDFCDVNEITNLVDNDLIRYCLGTNSSKIVNLLIKHGVRLYI